MIFSRLFYHKKKSKKKNKKKKKKKKKREKETNDFRAINIVCTRIFLNAWYEKFFQIFNRNERVACKSEKMTSFERRGVCNILFAWNKKGWKKEKKFFFDTIDIF